MFPSRPCKRIRKNSPFARLRALPRLGAVPAWSDTWFGDEGKSPWDYFPAVPLPDSHPAKRHFGFGQNDAEVLAINVDQDALELTLNHYDIERLACTQLDDPAKVLSSIRSAFPVTFRFGGLTDLVILRVVEQGRYQKMRCTQQSIGTAIMDVVQMQCVQYESARQLYVLQFHDAGWPFHRSGEIDYKFAHSSGYFLCIESASLTVREDYRQGWNELFNGQHLEILDAFDKVWPVSAWGVVDFEQWIYEREERQPVKVKE